MSQKEELILNLLTSHDEMYGLEMVRKSRGRLKRGTIYVTLSRLSEKGYVGSREDRDPESSGIPRRLYHITPHGKRAYLG